VNGTPSFFIDERRFDGPFTFDGFAEAIEARLNPKPPWWSRWRA
jgi:protein-disulfide isomerase